MTRAAGAAQANAAAPKDGAAPAVTGAGLVLLALLLVRTLLPETFVRLELDFLPATGQAELTPALTAWLDSLTLAAAVFVLALAQRWRAHLLVIIGSSLLVGGDLISAAAAGDGIAARLAGMNLVILTIAGAALVVLFRDGRLRRAALAGVVAVTVASAYRCINQRYYEFPALLESWEEQKAQLLAHGRSPDDPMLENYERRMRSLESYGYHYHPNVAGSMLMAGAIVLGAGLAAAGMRRTLRGAESGAGRSFSAGGVALWGGGLAWAALGYGLWLTGSNGAMIAALAAALTAGVLYAFRARCAAHARRWATTGVALYFVVMAGVALLGMSRGTLPGSSLAFRWEYWSAAMRAWETAPWTGIGRENFQDAYCQFKSAAAVEEVRDPHNLWVSLLVETGPAGLLGGLFLLGIWAVAALRSMLEASADTRQEEFRGAWLLAGLLILLLALHLGLSRAPLADSNIGFLWLIETAGVALIAGAIGWAVFKASQRFPPGAALLHCGIIAAAAGMLIHAWVDYALLTPAGAALFVILAAAAVSMRPEVHAGGASSRRIVLFGMLGLLAVDWFGVVRPVMEEQSAWRLLDQAVQRADSADQAAANVVSMMSSRETISPVVYARTLRVIRQLLSSRQLSESARRKLMAETAQFLKRPLGNPRDANTWELRAQLFAALANREEATGLTEENFAAAPEAYVAIRAAVERNPTNPRLRIRAAELIVRLADPLESPNPRLEDAGALEYARKCLDEALRVHGLWKPEEVARLREHELQRIEECRHDLQSVQRLARPAGAP